MHHGKFKLGVVLAGIAFFALLNASAQQIQPHSQRTGAAGAVADGTMTVTATVVSSVGVVIGPDGQQHVIVANAEDPRGSTSPLPGGQMVRVVTLSPVTEPKPDAKPAPVKLQQKP
jgi:hypothetical protein